MDVLCIGFACVDVVFPFVGQPPYDRKSEVHDMLLEGGGAASTAAVALRRLGCRVGLMSVVGDDFLGQFALQRLRVEGVDVSRVQIRPGARTPLSVILADPEGGARTILWNRGSVSPLAPEEVIAQRIDAKILLVDETYPAAATVGMDCARRAGIPVVFDAGTVAPGLESLVRNSDLLAASEHFPARWTGESDPRAALAALQSENKRPVISTRGVGGSWLHDGRQLYEFPAVSVAAKDTTAAGDAFHAAVVFGLLHEWPLDRICRFANYYAGQNCLRLGGRAGLLRLEDVGPWLDSLGEPLPPGRSPVKSPCVQP